MIIKRKILEIDENRCNGCGNCVVACAEGAIQIIDGKAKIVKDQYCDGLGACIGDCPEDALKIIEREAEEFDESAVEDYLKGLEKNKSGLSPTNPDDAKSQTLGCGCPSTHLKIFEPAPCSCSDANKPASLNVASSSSNQSTLGHWPVQIRLVPANAPFLKGADLLVAADCVPVAYPSFHQDFLKGKVVMVGCPKFDDVDSYIAKFADIFKTANIKSVTVLIMEVPCCSSLPMMVKKGADIAGVALPINTVVISPQGKIIG
ncbi:MAG: 4Fe-4S binding protein [Desulfamplus sp.]|nr:4Fe-4S binding protein [Desulfamplus sp.]